MSRAKNPSIAVLARANGAQRIGFEGVTVSQGIKRRTVFVQTLADLAGLQNLNDLDQVEMAEFWPGSGVGGGLMVWQATRSKADHDGMTVIDPDKVEELGAPGVFNQFFSPQLSGAGVFVRKETRFSVFTWAGGLPDQPSGAKTVLAHFQGLGRHVVMDLDEVNLGELGNGETVFDIQAGLNGRQFIGPCRLYGQGPTVTGEEATVFRPNGVSDYKIIDITVEDTANTANTADTTGRAGLHYCYADDSAASSKRVTLVRPKQKGGVSLLTAREEVSGVTHDDYSIEDGYAEDSYYGVNTANAGNGLKGNWRTKRVKRSYFPHGVHGHRVSVIAESQSIANAHCLIKSYGRKTRDLVVDYQTISSDSTAGGIVVFEHQDGTDPASIIEDVTLRMADDDGTKNFTVLFRAFDGQGAVMNSGVDAITRNIKIDGHTGGRLPLVLSQHNTPITVEYSATNGDAGISELLKTSVARQPNGPQSLCFKTGQNRFFRYAIGKSGTGAEVEISPGALIGTGTSFCAEVTVRAAIDTSQVYGAVQTVERLFLMGAIASDGSVSLSKANVVNSVSNGTPIAINTAANGKTLKFTAPVNDSTGWVSAAIEFI